MVPSPSPVARAEKFFVRVNQVLVRLWARLHASLTGWCQSRPACGQMCSEACCFVLSESLCAVIGHRFFVSAALFGVRLGLGKEWLMAVHGF